MLKLENVVFSFGGLYAVNDVSLELEAGRIWGLIGPNGAGKTTLFNLVSGVYRPDRGAVLFEGGRIDGLAPFQINRLGISRTYQNIHLFSSMSVLDNVLTGMQSRICYDLLGAIFRTPTQRWQEREARRRAMELLRFVGLDDRAGEKATSLPYGEQRRLEIARALAAEPRLLLLDEPAAGMNTNEKADLAGLIRRIRDQGYTILLIEHDMRLVMDITDHIFALNYGRLIAKGMPQEIRNNPEVIAAYLGGT